jgi:flagellar hook-associated protein 1 FlgK
MDQRDLLVTKLTKLAGVTVQDGDMGTVNVFVGGTALVRNDHYETLTLDTSTVPAPGSALANVGWNQAVVRWAKDGYPADIPSGEVWGLLQGANDAIPRYLDQLNGLANQLATQVNTLHQTGYGLNDPQQPSAPPNRSFFTVVAGPPYTNAAASLALDPAVDGQPENIAASNGTGVLDASIAQQMATMTSSATGPDAAFRQLVGALGVEVQTLSRRSVIQDEVTNQIDQSRQAVSGVNIDEEMTNLVQSQHAYDASARLLTTIDQMIDTIINRTGVVGR